MLAETVIRGLGGLLAYAMLAVLLYGIWRGTQRQPGRTTGRTGAWLRSPLFYLITSTLYFGLCFLGWKPLPLQVSACQPRLDAGGWLTVVLSGHALGAVGQVGVGQELFRLYRAGRAVVCRPSVGYRRTVCHPAPPHVRRNHPGSFRQPAALRHLDNPVPGLLCPADQRARPARGGCAGGRVWCTMAGILQTCTDVDSTLIKEKKT